MPIPVSQPDASQRRGQALTQRRRRESERRAVQYLSAVAVDNAGNVYVATRQSHDPQDCRLDRRRDDFAGAAGVPEAPTASASAARFNNPSGVAVDGRECLRG